MTAIGVGRHAIGVALSDSALHGPDGGTWALAPREGEAWPALRDALAALVSRTHAHERRLAVALLPPLASVRSVRLPKLRDDELTAVLVRNAARYVPGAREPQAVAAARVEPAGGEFLYAVAVAPAALLAAIERAARDAGLVVDQIIPAYSAWAAVAATRGPHLHRTAATIEIPRGDGGADRVRVVGGVPAEVRRLRRSDVDAQRGDVRNNDDVDVRVTDPIAAAANHATRTRALAFVTDAGRVRRRVRTRTRSVAAAVATAALVAATAGVAWWRVRADLRDVTAQRTAMRADVARAARLEATLASVAGPAQALARVEERAVRWSGVVDALAAALPEDASLEALRASNDSVAVDGVARNGARVFQAVTASGTFAGVAPVGPIRRDESGDAPSTTERFTLAARVPGAARLVPPPARRGR